MLRARAGDRLSQLGDPRFDAQRFFLPADDMLGFVRIAADPEFVIGTRNADREWVARIAGGEIDGCDANDLPTPTRDFHIARYPVTVAQFRSFVTATGLEIGGPDALADPASRPVGRVSWHEALAWCDWLNGMLATSPALAASRVAALVREDGWRVGLPSELEREKAARGGLRSAVFPWGDADDGDGRRGNHQASAIGETSVVGCFAPNGYALHDMAGNVWEWTRSPESTGFGQPDIDYQYRLDYREREDRAAAEDLGRVIRGGSFGDLPGFARCGLRRWAVPHHRAMNLGFRVVLRSSPVLPL